MPSLLSRYQEALASKSLHPDAAQEQAVYVLDALLTDLLKKPAKRSLLGFNKKPAQPMGLYLYGPVGRGKTMLMDLFLQQLVKNGITAERWHFHSFMLKMHSDLRDQSAHSRNLGGRIEKLADQWVARTKVLCFDEFHVTDVADAMIMMPLFTHMFKRGMVVLATSNWKPDELYTGGLQRQRFLPFIDTLQDYMRVVSVAGTEDYRAMKHSKTAAWLAPLNNDTEEDFDILFRDAVGYDPIETHEVHVGSRSLIVPKASKHVAQLNMEHILNEALGAADFIALADRYPLLFIDNLHTFRDDQNNKLKRFMVMIDVLYDKGTKLVVRADAPIEELYPKSGKMQFEFDRTMSRLKEMTPSRRSHL